MQSLCLFAWQPVVHTRARLLTWAGWCINQQSCVCLTLEQSLFHTPCQFKLESVLNFNPISCRHTTTSQALQSRRARCLRCLCAAQARCGSWGVG